MKHYRGDITIEVRNAKTEVYAVGEASIKGRRDVNLNSLDVGDRACILIGDTKIPIYIRSKLLSQTADGITTITMDFVAHE